MTKRGKAPAAGEKLSLLDSWKAWGPPIERRGERDFTVGSVSGTLSIFDLMQNDGEDEIIRHWLRNEIKEGRLELDGYTEAARAVTDGRAIIDKDSADISLIVLAQNSVYVGPGGNSEELSHVRVWRVVADTRRVARGQSQPVAPTPAGRPQRGHAKKDQILFAEMRRRIKSGEALSSWEAAGQLAPKAVGGGTPESKQKRLSAGYRAKYERSERR